MGQFLRINGDYNIKCSEGANIVLDTGPGVGQVTVTGDLIVQGDTTTVQAENLNVEDNIITVNFGETGAGISLTYAGLQADRGSLAPASFLYDETIDAWLITAGSPDTTFNYDDSGIKLRKILTDSATDSGDLTLIGTGTGVVKVIGTTNYEQQVTHDDDLPNKKYVDDAIQNNPTFQIVAPSSEDTKVVIADKDISPNTSGTPGSLEYFIDTTTYSTFGESAVSVIVDNTLNTQFYPNRTEMFDLEFNGSEITTRNSITNQNIFVRTQGTGKLQTNYAFQLEKLSVTPSYVADNTLLYSSEPDIGTTGVWFVNDSAEASKRNGELISKNKALVFSMIF
jgi:hypothetical protein